MFFVEHPTFPRNYRGQFINNDCINVTYFTTGIPHPLEHIATHKTAHDFDVNENRCNLPGFTRREGLLL